MGMGRECFRLLPGRRAGDDILDIGSKLALFKTCLGMRKKKTIALLAHPNP